jgi:hypothetical protein
VIASNLGGHVPLRQPITCVWTLLLLVQAAAAEAQPQALGERSITATSREPLPEVWVATGHRTAIVFDAPIEKASVELGAARVTLVDVGERSLILEPLVNPGEDERWVLRVKYADPPEWAAFVLVSRPGEVDLQLEVVRQRQTLENCQAELAQARGDGGQADVWALADRLRSSAVESVRVQVDGARGWSYRSEEGVLLVLEGRMRLQRLPVPGFQRTGWPHSSWRLSLWGWACFSPMRRPIP